MAAPLYKVGQEGADAIEAREHEHLEWQQQHYGEEGEPDFGGADDLISGVVSLYPGTSDGPRILYHVGSQVLRRASRTPARTLRVMGGVRARDLGIQILRA